jgi:endonuclease/exonuclease/phosphatase family metal-dependent hydrolase
MATLTVATLNLYGPPFRREERGPLVVQQLLDVRPDIIGFQEVDLTVDRGNWVCDRFNELLRQADGVQYRIYHVANPTRAVTRGALAVMTHLPLSFHDGVDYLVDLDWNRTAQRVRVELDGATLDFYNTHFHYLLGAAGDEIRREQSNKLLRWMDSHGWTAPKVLVGDFNAWPDSEPVRILKEKLASAYEAAHGAEPDKTWPSPLVKQANAPDWTLDYIFITGDVRVLDAHVVFDQPDPADPTLYPSDHFGLAAPIQIG